MRNSRCACLLVVAVVFLVGLPAEATTWSKTEIVDPISGEKTSVQVIVSYGNYIYNWPSKYDMVFWPFTDENWIWLSPASGYAAFGSDFEELSDAERERLKAWLTAKYSRERAPNSYIEKLEWLGKAYEKRQMDDSFWCMYYRLMAYVRQEDQKKSLEYVKKALPLIAKELEANPGEFERIQTLYLLGEYYRRIGEIDKAKSYFQQARTVRFKDKDGKEQVGHPYIIELIDNREKLMPGNTSK